MDDLAELALGNIQYAGFWVRFAAVMLDSLILMLIAVILGAVLALVGMLLGFGTASLQEAVWPNLLGLALSWLYFALLESGPRCATYGKRALHLQVLAAGDLTRIGFLRASARWVARLLSTILLLGYLMQPFTPRKRALHDYIAGTVVVVQARYSRVLVGIMIAVMVLLILLIMGAVMLPAYQEYVTRQRG